MYIPVVSVGGVVPERTEKPGRPPTYPWNMPVGDMFRVSVKRGVTYRALRVGARRQAVRYGRRFEVSYDSRNGRFIVKRVL